MFLVSLWSALFLAVEVWLEGQTLRIPDVGSLGILLLYGVMCQALGWLLISRNLPLVAVSIGGLTILLQPLLSFVWDMLIFSRPTTILDLAGAALVIVGIYAGVTRRLDSRP